MSLIFKSKKMLKPDKQKEISSSIKKKHGLLKSKTILSHDGKGKKKNKNLPKDSNVIDERMSNKAIKKVNKKLDGKVINKLDIKISRVDKRISNKLEEKIPIVIDEKNSAHEKKKSKLHEKVLIKKHDKKKCMLDKRKSNNFNEKISSKFDKKKSKIHEKLCNKPDKKLLSQLNKDISNEKIAEENSTLIAESSSTENDMCDENMPSALPQVGFTWGNNMEDLKSLLATEEDSDEDDEEVEVTQVKPKLTKAERAALAKAEEAKIRAAEDALILNKDPVSPDGFDRMLLAQPDCSELWVKYMAYYLQTTEIEKARAVARRALTVINIRRDADRLNVWTALMNLEHLYGTRDSLQSCVHEALRCNDEVKVYTNLMNIYATSGQIRELDLTVKLLLKKAGTNHDSVTMYLQCAHILLQHGQKDSARHILQRGLNNLPPAVHVTLISRFALAENKHGDPSRAQALFEHTLTSYPTRVDVWGVYVDMLVKSCRVDLARQVIQRAVSQKLPPKKLKPLYMKWLKLEEQHGDITAVENVKKEIEMYVKDTRSKLKNAKLTL